MAELMKPLLAKLATLAGDEYNKLATLKGVAKEVVFLLDELSAMDAFLEKMADADELDPLAKNWRSHVREMAYDIEDCIDDFMHHHGGADGKLGFLQKAWSYIKTLNDRYRMANQIQEMKARVIQAIDRRKRYKLDDCVSTSRSVAVDPRLPALYKEAASLVGIDGPRDQLIKWATDEEQQLKVVSIVGFGGLGKTTLANEVYREIGGQFNCKAFVSVSQRPDMTRLLIGLLSQLGLQHPSSHACEAQDLINNIREHLQHKRYFIIVDDLWDVRAWEIIRCAFPENNQRSRVMVTTRIEDVAKACCNNHKCIHVMKPLSHPDSKKLFFNRLFGSEDSCPPQFKEVSAEILKKCGGLPLAVITISGLLASQPARLKEQWENIRNSLGSQFATNPTLEGMRQILNLSYKDLPYHLKTCLLYLGMYPEDHEILRDDLVRRWIAEGFVSTLHGRDLVDVANSYFNELVNRSLIQPKYTRHTSEIFTCGVHDMMLDLILSRCAEDNFVSVVDDPRSMPGQHDKKVRRLSVNLVDGEDGTTVPATITNLSQLRSLAVFGKSRCIPPFLEFKFLRVLEFQVSGVVEGESRLDLTGITKLFQLRYLKISARKYGSRSSIQLPSQIRGLQQLETLEIWCKGVVSLPADIVDLPRLLHLIVHSDDTRLPDRIGNMESLRTLRRFDLKESSLDNIEALGELTNLRELDLYGGSLVADEATTTRMDALGSSVEKLRNLRRLFVRGKPVINGDGLSSFPPPPHHLEVLYLRGLGFSRVPRWVGHLQNLQALELTVREVLEDDVRVLGDLPSVTALSLSIPQAPAGRIVISGSGMRFPALKGFHFECDWMSYLTFTAGAMPNLQTLWLLLPLDTWDHGTPVGMEHLLSLKEISLGTPSRSRPPHRLVRLELRALIFSRFPRWVVHLHNLEALELTVREVLEDDVRVLGDLPSLTVLSLHIPQAPTERIVVSGSGMRFPALKRFTFECGWMSYLTFTAGAMPNLQTLWLLLPLDTWDHGTPVGMEHLLSLKQIYLWLAKQISENTTRSGEETVSQNTTQSEEEAAESTFRNAAQVHPSSPAFTKRMYHL